MRDEEPNYLVEALKSEYNLIALATALGFAVLSGSFFPLILAASAELTVLPLAERYQRYRRAKNIDTEKKRARETEVSDMLESLTSEEKQKYRRLEILAGEMRANYRGLDTSSRILLEDLVRKLDFLLAFYLRMRSSIVRYQSYFATTDPGEIRARIEALGKEIQEGPTRVQQIKARTRGVLMKRLERYEKAQENMQLMEAQTETVQEVLRLLRDQSFAMRDPRTIAEQLDGLVSSAEETERGVKDMEEILSAEQEVLMPGTEADSLMSEFDPAPKEQQAPPRVQPAIKVPPLPPVPEQPSQPPRKKVIH